MKAYQKINLFIYLVSGVGSDRSIKFISKKIPNIRYEKILKDEDKAFYPKYWKDNDLWQEFMDYLKEKDPEE